jgi:putative transposase
MPSSSGKLRPMARAPRIDVGGEIYHVINRANGRLKIFESQAMYAEFEALLKEIKYLFEIEILAFVIMPNHWHLLVRPKQDGDLAKALHWLTSTHTRRFHAKTGTIGAGHLYQGRYKSFLVQGDKHLLTVLKYIERNAVRAKLCSKAESWKWGSAYHRQVSDISLISPAPAPLPADYPTWINTPEPTEGLKEIRHSVEKGVPYGSSQWQQALLKRYTMAEVLKVRDIRPQF